MASRSAPGQHERERAGTDRDDIVGDPTLDRQEVIGVELDDAFAQPYSQVPV